MEHDLGMRIPRIPHVCMQLNAVTEWLAQHDAMSAGLGPLTGLKQGHAQFSSPPRRASWGESTWAS